MAQLHAIRVKGHLIEQRFGRFSGFTITLEPDGTTCLTGQVVDQAALYGLLRRVRGLSLPLISVNPLPETTTNS